MGGVFLERTLWAKEANSVLAATVDDLVDVVARVDEMVDEVEGLHVDEAGNDKAKGTGRPSAVKNR